MKIRFDKIKSRELTKAVSEVIAPIVAQKKEVEFNATIANDVPDSFSGDLTRIKQVLINLLSNAVKFTNKGSVVLRLETNSAQQILDSLNDPSMFVKSWANSDYFVKFTVQDKGIGIDPSDYNKIFSAFEQVKLIIGTISNLITSSV